MSQPHEPAAAIESTILNRIRAVRPIAGVDDSQLADMKLRRLLDSLDMLELIAYLEQTFGIKIADHDVVGRNFETGRSVAEFVRRKMASPTQA